MQLSRLHTASWALCLGVLTGCASTVPSVKDSGDYSPASLQDAEVMPVIAEERSNIKIIVVEAADGSDALARAAKVGSHLSQSVAHLLSGRGIEVVDDALAPSLGDALRTAELASSSGTSNYVGPKVANFTIKPVISSTSYGATYNPPSQYKDKKGRITNVPGSYSHSAALVASLRIYEMPSLRLVGTVNVKGSASASDPSTGANAGTGMAMLRDSAESAANNNRADLLNLFASKGYVVARRLHGTRKTSAFQVSMGKLDGLKAGDKVDVFSVRPTDNTLLKSAPATEEIFVASGTVAPMLLTDSTAWVALDEEEKAPRVRRGDLVKQKHTKGFFDAFQ